MNGKNNIKMIKKMIKKVSIIGFGSWGIALSLQLNRNGCEVTAWQRSSAKNDEIRAVGCSREYLPGVPIPKEIILTSDFKDLSGADVVIFAAGSGATFELAKMYAPLWTKDQILVSASKGLESGKRLSETIALAIPGANIAVISGPCHAEELASGLASAYVAASLDVNTSKTIQDTLMSTAFRVYTNPDIIGVELGGAFKNCIAIAVGLSDGLGHGDNARAALITRGIAEISRLGVAMGAKPETFSGLAGTGDLIVTCTSKHSRNLRLGQLIGKGKTLQEALAEIRMIVEGVNTVKQALDLAQKYGVRMPIITELHKVLFENKAPELTARALMERDKTSEKELYW